MAKKAAMHPSRTKLSLEILLPMFVFVLSVNSAQAQSVKIAEIAEAWDPFSAERRPLVRLVEGGKDLPVKLSPRVRTVERVSAYGSGRLLVLGHTSGAEALTVVSSISAAVEDEFLAYAASVSPNGRFVAFERFSQPHGPELLPVVMIYDLDLTARDNRIGKSTVLDTLKNVGRPIYPIDHARRGRYEEQPLTPSTPRRITNLFWLDRDTVSFIAYTPGDSRLIVVRGKPDFSRPQYESYPLDHKLVINQQALGIGDDPAPLFFRIADALNLARPAETVPPSMPPPGVSRVVVCADSGELPNAHCAPCESTRPPCKNPE